MYKMVKVKKFDFFFYMNVMVWLCVMIIEILWYIKYIERISCKLIFNCYDFMLLFFKINWCVLISFMIKFYLYMCFNNNYIIRIYW